MDIDAVSKAYNFSEITNPVHFDRGQNPTPDGLFSYEIFGRTGSKERERTFAYINLDEYFLHPIVYNALYRLNRKIDSCIAGTRNFIIKDGLLVEDEENGKTGLKFLYDNWEHINFAKNSSIARNIRVDISNIDRKLAFFNKQIVMPPFYRDINFETKTHDEINDHYAKLLRLIKSLKLAKQGEIGTIGNSTRHNIQTTINDIYAYCSGKIPGKTGLFRQAVMGKSIDYGYRTVISSARFNVERYEDLVTTYEYAGVPLSQICVLFFPFIVSKLVKFFSEFQFMPTRLSHNKKEVDIVEIDKEKMDMFNYENLSKQINKFIRTPADRFELIKVPFIDKKTKKSFLANINFLGNRSNMLVSNKTDADSVLGFVRNMTWADLIYISAYDVVKDKHVVITRYPIADYYNMVISKIHIRSTLKTIKVFINDELYETYPLIDLSMPKDKQAIYWIDTLQIFNSFLNGLGADFDGDQVTIRGEIGRAHV